ncbi:hypothetical protein OROHE_019741 [Orobanche hederae]
MEKSPNPAAAAAAAPPPSSQTEKDDIEKVFNKFDTNGDGKISPAELGDVLNSLGSETSADEVGRLMSELDRNGDGYVDLSEFKSFQLSGYGDAELKDAFDLYDKDKDGKISAGELQAVLRSMQENRSIEDCERMIDCFDVDGDGYINFKEFKEMMNRAS